MSSRPPEHSFALPGPRDGDPSVPRWLRESLDTWPPGAPGTLGEEQPPADYFQTFPQRVLREARRQVTAEAHAELPPNVAEALDLTPPASVPSGTRGYFENFGKTVWSHIRSSESETEVPAWLANALDQALQPSLPDEAQAYFTTFFERVQARVKTGVVAADWPHPLAATTTDAPHSPVPAWLVEALDEAAFPPVSGGRAAYFQDLPLRIRDAVAEEEAALAGRPVLAFFRKLRLRWTLMAVAITALSLFLQTQQPDPLTARPHTARMASLETLWHRQTSITGDDATTVLLNEALAPGPLTVSAGLAALDFDVRPTTDSELAYVLRRMAPPQGSAP